jgi:hypothetical protein
MRHWMLYIAWQLSIMAYAYYSGWVLGLLR